MSGDHFGNDETGKWIRRFKRVMKDCPEGFALYGMDDDLLLVDLAAMTADPGYVRGGKLRGEQDLTFVTNQDKVWVGVYTGPAYGDSGGF